MLERLPTISIADVKVGDTIIVSSTQGVDPTRLTAISLVTGADTVETVAVYIGMLGFDFTATKPPELVDHLRTLAKRYAKAVEEPYAAPAVLESESYAG